MQDAPRILGWWMFLQGATLRSGNSGQTQTGLWVDGKVVFPKPLLFSLGKLRSRERRELPG